MRNPARALWDNPEAAKRLNPCHPIRKSGEPDEIAGAAVFSAAPAGNYVERQIIGKDGELMI